jgi:hypothetical protein
MDIGFCEGDECSRNGCKGVIAIHPVENCSCHISPPCSACTSPRGFCPVCGWEECDDMVINDYVVNVDHKTGVYRTWTERPLNTSKIDWRSYSHTNSSMIKRGCYPDGVTSKEVEKEVRGTFGGRFNYFDNGKFEYIAYTD